MKPNIPSQAMPSNSLLDLLDRSREEVSILFGQYHALKHEFEKLSADKNELQKHYILHYEMSHALNVEMHKQMEVLKRIQTSCSQILHFLPPEPQAQLAQILEQSKQLACHDPGLYPPGQLPGSINGMPMSAGSMPPSHPGMHPSNGNGPSSYTPVQQMPMNAAVPPPPSLPHPHSYNNNGPQSLKEERVITPDSPGTRSISGPVSMPPQSRHGRSSKSSIGTNGMDDTSNHRNGKDRSINDPGITGGSSSKGRSKQNSKSKDRKSETSEETGSDTEEERENSSENDNGSNGNSSSPRNRSMASPSVNMNDSSRLPPALSGVNKYHNMHQSSAGRASTDYMLSSQQHHSHHSHHGGVGGPMNNNYMRGSMSSQYPYMMGGHLGGTGMPPHPDVQPPTPHQYHQGPPPPPAILPPGNSSYMRGGIGGGHSMRGGGAYDPSMSHMNSRMRLPPPSSPYSMPHMMYPPGGGSGGGSRQSTVGGSIAPLSSYHHSHPGGGSRMSNSITSDDSHATTPSPGFASGGNGAATGSPKALNALGTLPHGEVICAITMSTPVRHIFTGGKGSVKVWETSSVGMPNISPVLSLDCFTEKYIRSCKLLPHGESLLVGGESETIVLWDLNTGQMTMSMSLRSVIETNYAACYAVAVSPDSKLCYSCINDGKIAIWDLSSRTLVRELMGHENGSSCIDLLNDGMTFWTGGLDQDIRFWDLREGRSISEFHCEAQVFTLSLAPNAEWLAAGLENSSIEVIHPKTSDRYVIQAHESCVMSLKVAKSGRWMASTGKDSTVRCFRMPKRIEEVCYPESNLMLSCDIADNESILVAGSASASAIVYKPVF